MRRANNKHIGVRVTLGVNRCLKYQSCTDLKLQETWFEIQRRHFIRRSGFEQISFGLWPELAVNITDSTEK